MVNPASDIDGLDIDALKALVMDLLERDRVREGEMAALRGEVRRLKGLSGPPEIKPPSGMDKKARSRTKAKASRAANKARRGAKKDRVRIDERRVIEISAPEGSVFKGYEPYVVQDLLIRPHTVELRRQRFVTPDGGQLVAPLPDWARGIRVGTA